MGKEESGLTASGTAQAVKLSGGAAESGHENGGTEHEFGKVNDGRREDDNYAADDEESVDSVEVGVEGYNEGVDEQKEKQKAHTGLERVEILILRHIFGYGPDLSETETNGTTDPEETISDGAGEGSKMTPSKLPSRDWGRRLSGSGIHDFLFVSIDVDTSSQGYREMQPDKDYSIGISTFDTLSLAEVITAATSEELDGLELIKSYQFVVGSGQNSDKARKRFFAGTSRDVKIEELKSEMHRIIGDRRHILIVHGGKNDKDFLNALQICGQAIDIVDTQAAAQAPLNLSNRKNLRALLEAFEMHPIASRLHTGGNDAYYAMKALLMIVVKDIDNMKDRGQPHPGLANALERIAQALHPLETPAPNPSCRIMCGILLAD